MIVVPILDRGKRQSIGWRCRPLNACPRTAESLLQRFHERHYPRSKHSRSVWAGGLTGVSSYGTDFNYDFRASFTPEEIAKSKVDYNFELVEFPSAEAPGISVFYKDENENIFPYLLRLGSRNRERREHVQLPRSRSQRPR